MLDNKIVLGNSFFIVSNINETYLGILICENYELFLNLYYYKNHHKKIRKAFVNRLSEKYKDFLWVGSIKKNNISYISENTFKILNDFFIRRPCIGWRIERQIKAV